MKTFSAELKQKYIDIMQAHQDADHLAQGNWWNDDAQKGCFFGCAMQTDDDDALEKAIEEMQLPAWLVHLAEKIFEGLPAEEALLFPVQLLESTPTDADIESVKHKIAIARLERINSPQHGEKVGDAIEHVSNCHRQALAGEQSINWVAAWSAARSAAWSATWSAESAAESESAAWSAAWSAASESARSAARSAESATSRLVAWQQERDTLLKALKEQPL